MVSLSGDTMNNEKLQEVKNIITESSKLVLRGYGRITEDFLTQYWEVFIDWLTELDKYDPKAKTFSCRDDKGKWEKGLELAFFRFLFPKRIPEKEYTKDQFYQFLKRTVHNRALTEVAGLPKPARKPRVSEGQNEEGVYDEKGVKIPTGAGEVSVILKSPVFQAVMATLANLVANDRKKLEGNLPAYLLSLQVPKGTIDVLKQEQAKYLDAELAIRQARREQASRHASKTETATAH
jgi:hypothetical protein